MLKAKLIAISEIDEYEVTLEINGAILLCFAVVCPYKIEVGKSYSIDFSLKVNENVEPKILNNELYSLKKIGKGYGYILQGRLTDNKLDLGVFSIQDEFLTQFPILNRKFIELEIQGLWVTFLLSQNN